MFKDIVTWFDSYFSHEEPSSVPKAMLGLMMAFAGLLGALFGNELIRVGAFAVVIVVAMSVVLALLAERQRLQQRYSMHRILLDRYCDFVIEHRAEPLVAIDSWRQRVYLQLNGDVREVLTLKAVALRPKVYFIRITASSLWEQPEKYRRHVKVMARTLTVNGVVGPRWNVTNRWRTTEKIVSILHLRHPISRGEEVHFEVERTWPAKCLPLVRGEAEEFAFKASKLLEVRHVDYSVVLPVGVDAVYEVIGAGEPDVRLSVDTEFDTEGRRVFVWRADKVPEWTSVGIRLELK